MAYTSKYAQDAMDKVTGRKDKEPKLQTHKAGGSGQATEKRDKKEAKNAKRNAKVAERRSKDMDKGRTKNLGKKSRTYKI